MNQLPAHLQARQRRDLASAALGGLNSGAPPHISIAGNRFTLIDDAGNEKPINTLNLDVCVIDANPSVSKIYFDPSKPFVAGGDNDSPPICWSDNGIGASAQAAQPQHNSCQLCPHNAWGSKVNPQGKQIKACNDVKKLAVLVPGIDMVFLLRIPPASLKNLAKYTQTLGGHGVDLPDALTRLEFESQGVLKFTPVGYVDEPTAAITDRVWEAKATDQLLGKTDRPWGGQALPAPAAAPQIAQTAPVQQFMPPPAPVAQAAPAAPAFMAPPIQQAQPFGGAQPSSGPFGSAPQATDSFGSPTATPISSTPFPSSNGQIAPIAAPPSETPKRTRRTKAEIEADKAAQAAPAPASFAPAADTGIPPFLQRAAAPAQAPVQAPPAPAFGMDPTPAAPDAGITAALDAAFRLPT